jgi:hypothetical protein
MNVVVKPDWFPEDMWKIITTQVPEGYTPAYWLGCNFHTFCSEDSASFYFGDVMLNPFPEGSQNFLQFQKGFIDTRADEERIMRVEALVS